MTECAKTGCRNKATCSPRLILPLSPRQKPMELVVNLALCDAHFAEVEASPGSIVVPQLRERLAAAAQQHYGSSALFSELRAVRSALDAPEVRLMHRIRGALPANDPAAGEGTDGPTAA